MLVNTEMKPINARSVREELGMSRAQLAREAVLQAGQITHIETGRFVPYESQAEKIVAVFNAHGWEGDPSWLFEPEEE